MGHDIKWHHCFSGIPLLTSAQSKQKFQFSGGFQTGLFFLKRITQHNNNKHLGNVCLQVCLYLPRSHRILPKLFAWLFWAIRQHAVSIVLPAIIFCAGFLMQSLACLGKSQRLSSCSGLTSSLLGMPVNALTTATEQLTRAVIQKTADSKGILQFMTVSITSSKNMIALNRWMCLQHNLMCQLLEDSHTSRTGTVLRVLPRPTGATFLCEGIKCCIVHIWSIYQNSRRNSVLFIWHETIPDHTAYCFLGRSH